MKEYLEQRLVDLKKNRRYFKKQMKELKDVGYDAAYSPSLNHTIGAIEEIENTLNYLNAQAESQNINNNESHRKRLIDFSNFLNTYKGLEEVRFDFMVIDYLESIKCD